MLINLSNHPSAKWSEKQTQKAIELYGTIQDIPFPQVNPQATSDDIKKLANDYIEQVRQLAKANENQPFAVHIMGEMTLTFQIVMLLKDENIPCVASTTFRDTIEHSDGTKTVTFSFIQFRAYF